MKLRSTRNLREASNVKRAKRRQELINIVHHGFDVAGEALRELRDDEHWKDTHNTFAEFCKATFNISKTKLYVIIRTLEVVVALPKELQSKITNEAQALALLKVDPNARAKAIVECEKNGGVTAENILLHGAKKISSGDKKTNVTSPVTECGIPHSTLSEKTESKIAPKSKPTPSKKEKIVIYDDNGTPIPDDAIPYWNRRQEVQEVLTQISRLKSIVVGGREKQDRQWLKVTNSIENNFDSLRSLISEAKPYAVCTTCMGSPSLQPEGCNFCRSTGLISKWQWETQSRQEVKDIVMRRAEDLKKERENVH